MALRTCLSVSAGVRAALQEGRPIVALESTIITHGLPKPINYETAVAAEEAVRKAGAEPLTFGMTFPFSTHNYQLRFWMAAGGVDPDEDVRLVVLPPPYMVDSIANGHVDAFCVDRKSVV